MDLEVEFGSDPPEEEQTDDNPIDLDEYLAKNSFRIVYQANNFFLPRIRDMIENKEAINLRPEYQRRLRCWV